MMLLISLSSFPLSRASRLGCFWEWILCLKFSLNYLRFSFARETDLPKKPKIFGKHQFLNEILSIDFSGLSVNFIIRELKFCKLAQFFCVSFSHERKSERIERRKLKKHKIRAFGRHCPCSPRGL